MRVVLTLTEPIPELVEMLARAGAHVTLVLDDPEYPVSVTAHLGPEALEILKAHARQLSPTSETLPHVPSLTALLRVLGYEPRWVKVVE